MSLSSLLCYCVVLYYFEITEWQGYHLYLLVRRFMRDANWTNVCQQLWTILKHFEVDLGQFSATRNFENSKPSASRSPFSLNLMSGRWCIIGCKLVSGARLSGEPEVLPRCPQLPPHQASPEKLLPKLKTKILEAQIRPSFNFQSYGFIVDFLAMQWRCKLKCWKTRAVRPHQASSGDQNWEISPKISSATKIRWSTELRQDLRLKDVCSRKGPVPPKRR